MRRFRFTIAVKLSVGFGIMLVAVLITSYLTYTTLDENRKVNKTITEVYAPSASYLNDLYFMITNSKMLIKNWVFIEKKEDTKDKIRLKVMHEEDFPFLKAQLDQLVSEWQNDDQLKYATIINKIDDLFGKHQEIMATLNTFESYNDLISKFTAEDLVGEKGEVILLTDEILGDLNILLRTQEELVEKSNNEMANSFAEFQDLIFLMGVLLVMGIFVVAVITTRALVTPVNNIKRVILRMAQGILPKENLKIHSGDEIGEMNYALNQLVAGLRDISSFALQIGEGNFESEFAPLSKEDQLGNSLIIMRENLKKASKDAELRRIENSQRSWSAQGLATFGELLRNNNDNLEKLSRVIIIELAKYLNASVGGLFVASATSKRSPILELTAFYAYNRERFFKKKVKSGENLVGQCFQEKQKIFLTDLPKGYVSISSGLGADDPKSLLIVPLLLNEEIYGVIELASFKVFEHFEIEFVEKISESIASSIASLRINMNTARLLEESNEKSERLAKQEEEVRKNIKKMQEAQEELIRREEENKRQYEQTKREYEVELIKLHSKFTAQQKELQSQQTMLANNLNAINQSMGALELDLNGKVLNVNTMYLKLSKLAVNDIKGKHIADFMSPDVANSKEYKDLWPKFKRGETHSGGHQYFFKGEERWFFETFTPVKNEKGKIYKIIVLAEDISKVREQEENSKQKIQALQDELAKIKRKYNII